MHGLVHDLPEFEIAARTTNPLGKCVRSPARRKPVHTTHRSLHATSGRVITIMNPLLDWPDRGKNGITHGGQRLIDKPFAQSRLPPRVEQQIADSSTEKHCSKHNRHRIPPNEILRARHRILRLVRCRVIKVLRRGRSKASRILRHVNRMLCVTFGAFNTVLNLRYQLVADVIRCIRSIVVRQISLASVVHDIEM